MAFEEPVYQLTQIGKFMPVGVTFKRDLQEKSVYIPIGFLEESEAILTIAEGKPPGRYIWDSVRSRPAGGNEPFWEPIFELLEISEWQKGRLAKEQD